MTQVIAGSDLRDSFHSCEHTCILFHIVYDVYGMCGSMATRMIPQCCSITVSMDIQISVW